MDLLLNHNTLTARTEAGARFLRDHIRQWEEGPNVPVSMAPGTAEELAKEAEDAGLAVTRTDISLTLFDHHGAPGRKHLVAHNELGREFLRSVCGILHGTSVILPEGEALAAIEEAEAAGLDVARQDAGRSPPVPGALEFRATKPFMPDPVGRALRPTPSPAVILNNFRRAYPETAAVGRELSEDPENGEVGERHTATLRALRGQLEGEDKTAVRWALNYIDKLEERLDRIHKLSS